MSNTLKALLIILVVMIIVPIVLVVVGYTRYGSFRMGWIGSNYGDHISYHYTFFDGHETSNHNVRGADTLTVEYTITVNDGSLDLQVVNLDNYEILWEQHCDQTIEDQVQLDVSSIDRVQIHVIGHETQGDFRIRPIIQ